MRLWHKDSIDVLPRQQLIGQWRECCAIARNIALNGTPNHLLVNRVLDYPIEHFITYSRLIYDEMIKRGYRCRFNNFEVWAGKFADVSRTINYSDLFYGWHDIRYLNQCYFNLQEKFDCGGIGLIEWETIDKKFVDCLAYEGIYL